MVNILGYKTTLFAGARLHINSLTPRDSTEKLFKDKDFKIRSLKPFRAGIISLRYTLTSNILTNHIFKLCVKVIGKSLVAMTLPSKIDLWCVKLRMYWYQLFNMWIGKQSFFTVKVENEGNSEGYKSQIKCWGNIQTNQTQLNLWHGAYCTHPTLITQLKYWHKRKGTAKPISVWSYYYYLYYLFIVILTQGYVFWWERETERERERNIDVRKKH